MGVAREVIWQEEEEEEEEEGEGEDWEGVGRLVVASFCHRPWVAVGACLGERWCGGERSGERRN